MYSDKVMEHFRNPKNMGELKDADGVGEVGNVVCGDFLKIFIKVGKNKKGEAFIKDIKFQTYGCASAIASSSMLTELAKGKTIDEAKKITRDLIAGELGGLPPQKIHCSVLAQDALKKAIEDYEKKKTV